MRVVHSSLVADFVQETEELEKQKEESNDEDTVKKISQEIEITVVKGELANSKKVKRRAITLWANSNQDATCHQ